MKNLSIQYFKFALVKSIFLFLMARLAYIDYRILNIHFSYILLLESVIFGIYLIAINKDAQNKIGVFAIWIVLLQWATLIVVRFELRDYRNYYIDDVLLNVWIGYQAILFIVFGTFIYMHIKRLGYVSMLLLLGAISVALFTILSKKMSGDNSHLYVPIVWIGILYLALGAVFRMMIRKMS